MISARSALSTALFAAVFFVVFLVAPPARAQLHWDMNVHGGVSKRFFTGNGGLAGSLGPLVGVAGDFSLLPLLRLGAYADFENADTGEPASPKALSFGARLKVAPPVNFKNTHFWLFTGFGVADWIAPGYHQTVFLTGTSPTLATAPSTGGYFFEVPVGVGGGWRFRKPWELIVELQGRIGFAASGGYFADSGSGPSRTATVPSQPDIGFSTGKDFLALMLTAGIGLDE